MELEERKSKSDCQCRVQSRNLIAPRSLCVCLGDGLLAHLQSNGKGKKGFFSNVEPIDTVRTNKIKTFFEGETLIFE